MSNLQILFRDFVKSVNFKVFLLIAAVKIYNHFIYILEMNMSAKMTFRVPYVKVGKI